MGVGGGLGAEGVVAFERDWRKQGEVAGVEGGSGAYLEAALGDGEGEAFSGVGAADDGGGGCAAEADFEMGAGDEVAVGVW